MRQGLSAARAGPRHKRNGWRAATERSEARFGALAPKDWRPAPHNPQSARWTLLKTRVKRS